MANKWSLLTLVAAIGLWGCATIPTGPSVMVLPGQGKPFELFQADDAICRQWADQQVGTTPGQASTESAVSSAAIGTLLGAGLGAAIGAAAGNPGLGAAIGAGSGLLGGTMYGAGASQAAAGTVQWRYDIAYEQCMYAKGNQIPVAVRAPQPHSSAPPPPPPPPPPSPSDVAPTPPPPPSSVAPPPPQQPPPR
jgi:hypothetical protein